jgi:hypothetical protein
VVVGDGVITKADLNQVYEKSGIDMDSKKSQKMVERQFRSVAGREHDGRITFDAFAKKQLPAMKAKMRVVNAFKAEEGAATRRNLLRQGGGLKQGALA